MNTHEGYSKKTITDINVLLAGGGDKSLADFIGGIQYVSASSKILIKTAEANASWTDLVTLYNNKVTQNATTTDANYRLLLKCSANNTNQTDIAKYATTLYYNPYSQNLNTTSLNNIRIKYSIINDSTNFTTNFLTDVFGINDSNWAKFAVTRFNLNGPISIIPESSSHASGIAWEGADTFGGMTFSYAKPHVKLFGGNNGGNDGNPVWYYELRGTHAKKYNLDLLDWVWISAGNQNNSATPQHTRWYKLCIINATAGNNIENDWMIEIYSYSDQNYASFYHGYLRLSAYSTNSTSIVLSSSPNAVYDGHDAPHIYATIDSARQIWLGVKSLYTCHTKFRVIQEGSLDTIIKSAWQEQTTPPNSKYIIDNGQLHNYNGNVEPLTLDNVIALYKTTAISDGESTHWSKFGIKEYEDILPDALASVNSHVFNRGAALSIASQRARLDVYFSDISTETIPSNLTGVDYYNDYIKKGIYVRSGWNNTKRNWERLYTGGQDLLPDTDRKNNIGYIDKNNLDNCKRYRDICASGFQILYRHNEMSPRKFGYLVNSNGDYVINSNYIRENCGPDNNERTIWNDNLGTWFCVESKFQRRFHVYRNTVNKNPDSDDYIGKKRYFYHTISNVLEPMIAKGKPKNDGSGDWELRFGTDNDYFEFGAVSTTDSLTPNPDNWSGDKSSSATFYSTMNAANDPETSPKYAFGYIKGGGSASNYANGAARIYISVGANPWPGYSYDESDIGSAGKAEILKFSWFGPNGKFYTNGVLQPSDEAYKKDIEHVSENVLDNIYEWSKTAIIKYKYDYNGDNIPKDYDDEEEPQDQPEVDDPLIPKPGDWNYDYYMAHEEERPHYGVSAQNLFTILPETTCYDGFNNLRSVNYSELHSVMIAALIKQIEDLKERVRQLEVNII